MFNALKQFVIASQAEEGEKTNAASMDGQLEQLFRNMIEQYDFMSVVMYPDLQHRREFIHDCWIIAKARENDELKMAVTMDPFFYLTRDDLL